MFGFRRHKSLFDNVVCVCVFGNGMCVCYCLVCTCLFGNAVCVCVCVCVYLFNLLALTILS